MARAALDPAKRGARYTAVAIALHWLIGLAILAMLAMGLAMVHAPISTADKFKLYQLHKSVGLTILALAALRLAWRLGHRPPPLPADMPGWEKGAAEATHVVLYMLMIGLPLAGWAIVSTSPFSIPTLWFGVLRVPDLTVLTALGPKKALEPVFKAIHAYGAYVLIGLFALHAGAALRHYLVLHDDVLQRMIPGLPRLARRRPAEETAR
ncbi:MAG: cytochrome b [Actinomycetospora chiangmaiensis]|nr:cytochrome b [Actinomycetospora chiangmaiensis]